MQVTLFKFTVLIYISKTRYKSYNVTFENLPIKKKLGLKLRNSQAFKNQISLTILRQHYKTN